MEAFCSYVVGTYVKRVCKGYNHNTTLLFYRQIDQAGSRTSSVNKILIQNLIWLYQVSNGMISLHTLKRCNRIDWDSLSHFTKHSSIKMVRIIISLDANGLRCNWFDNWNMIYGRILQKWVRNQWDHRLLIITIDGDWDILLCCNLDEKHSLH